VFFIFFPCCDEDLFFVAWQDAKHFSKQISANQRSISAWIIRWGYFDEVAKHDVQALATANDL